MPHPGSRLFGRAARALSSPDGAGVTAAAASRRGLRRSALRARQLPRNRASSDEVLAVVVCETTVLANRAIVPFGVGERGSRRSLRRRELAVPACSPSRASLRVVDCSATIISATNPQSNREEFPDMSNGNGAVPRRPRLTRNWFRWPWATGSHASSTWLRSSISPADSPMDPRAPMNSLVPPGPTRPRCIGSCDRWRRSAYSAKATAVNSHSRRSARRSRPMRLAPPARRC